MQGVLWDKNLPDPHFSSEEKSDSENHAYALHFWALPVDIIFSQEVTIMEA